MNGYKARCEIIGEYIVNTGSTVRDAAKKFGISKSTVHKDVTFNLQFRNFALFEDVRSILDKHKEERHLRGGEATRLKYLYSKRDE